MSYNVCRVMQLGKGQGVCPSAHRGTVSPRRGVLLVGARVEAEDVVQDAFARIELRWAVVTVTRDGVDRSTVADVAAAIREVTGDEWRDMLADHR